jgi:hypothetical protein
MMGDRTSQGRVVPKLLEDGPDAARSDSDAFAGELLRDLRRRERAAAAEQDQQYRHRVRRGQYAFAQAPKRLAEAARAAADATGLGPVRGHTASGNINVYLGRIRDSLRA